jgi:hypothetical protein
MLVFGKVRNFLVRNRPGRIKGREATVQANHAERRGLVSSTGPSEVRFHQCRAGAGDLSALYIAPCPPLGQALKPTYSLRKRPAFWLCLESGG